ncbi:MAG: DUF1295 domain-containing protein [Cryobacterium sp.]|nr:DUF1295 domain-containing protein [Oligoflexia bacterium]
MTPLSLPALVGLLTSGSFLLFSLAWFTGKRLENYSIVDALWALSFGFFALLIILLSPGYTTRKFLFGGMFLIWSLRLGIYLTSRIFGHLDHEDERYRNLRVEYGGNVDLRFYLFYIYQALSVIFLLAPLIISSTNPDPEITRLEITGALIWVIGLIGESVSDAQKAAFRGNAANRGKICSTGLWAYSRHPNYFFESVIWVGYGVFAIATPHGWMTLYAPILMITLLLKVTGVPLAEKNALKTYGDAFRKYQKETSLFIPLPKRKA